MDSRIIVERAWLSHNGRRVNFSYRGTGRAAKYFMGRPTFYAEYQVDLSQVPESILLVPLVANLAPIAWFAGVPLVVATLDASFLAALGRVKDVFIKDYPGMSGRDSPIEVGNPIENVFQGEKRVMLFSGGVDAYATFFRHREEGLDLVSIRGADIAIGDAKQWQRLVDETSSEHLLSSHRIHHVEANLREFYTYHVNLLIPSKAWWGTIQHGLALITLVAPLGVALGYGRVYIASTHTKAIKMKWGSSPDIDNNIAWSGCVVSHDGYELTRMEKIQLIVSGARNAGCEVKLRVCYSELNEGLNCSRCEKCLRTMLGLSLSGANPAQYGLKPDKDTYARIIETIRGGFSTEGVRYLWWQFHKIMESGSISEIHLLGDEAAYHKVRDALSAQLARPVSTKKESALKATLIGRFPRVFSLYLKFRRRFS